MQMGTRIRTPRAFERHLPLNQTSLRGRRPALIPTEYLFPPLLAIFRCHRQSSGAPGNLVHGIPFSCTNFQPSQAIFRCPRQLCARNTLFVHKVSATEVTWCTEQPFRAQTSAVTSNLTVPQATWCTEYPIRAQTFSHQGNFVHGTALSCTNFRRHKQSSAATGNLVHRIPLSCTNFQPPR